MITLYGISNCDTVKKARRWLEEHGVEYRFHDFRRDGITEQQLRAWVSELGWERMINTRGTTWRRLPESLRADMTEKRAVALMLEHPSVIKRPLLDLGTVRHVGLDAKDYAQWLH
jgi:Spx/MgsR family transcriptional regulator